MSRMLTAALTLVPLLLLSAPAGAKGKVDTAPQLRYNYKLSGVDALDNWVVKLKTSQFMEMMVGVVDAQYKLPRTMSFNVEACKMANAFYLPKAGSITLCLELLAEYDALFTRIFNMRWPKKCKIGQPCKERSKWVEKHTMATATFVVWHELGHALVSELDLPATGRNEDVADQIATYIANMGPPDKTSDLVKRALSGALVWFESNHRKAMSPKHKRGLNFAGHHSLDQVRRNNLACWFYGKDPEKRQGIGKLLPNKRRVRCKREWTRFSSALDRLLKPHRFPKATTLARFDAIKKVNAAVVARVKDLGKTCKAEVGAYAKLLGKAKPVGKDTLKRLVKRFTNKCYMDEWNAGQKQCAKNAGDLAMFHRCLGLSK